MSIENTLNRKLSHVADVVIYAFGISRISVTSIVYNPIETTCTNHLTK